LDVAIYVILSFQTGGSRRRALDCAALMGGSRARTSSKQHLNALSVMARSLECFSFG
jgi:hypothetical protein